MPMLSEHWSSGNYMTEGEHQVTVKDVKLITFNSGNKGVEFTVINHQRQESKVAFVLMESAYWRLAQFVAACGFTQEQCKNYNTHSMESHRRCIGRQLMVKVESVKNKDGKAYNQITSFWVLENTAHADDSYVPVEMQTAPQQEFDPDEIPF